MKEQLRDKVKSLIKHEFSEGIAIANLSVNGRIKTHYAIYAAGHWYDRLRQAEQIIIEKTNVLKKQGFASETRSLWCTFFDRFLAKLGFKAIASDDALSIALIRDAAIELETAIAFKEQILAEHPEAIASSFEELQETAGKEAFAHAIGSKIAARILAQSAGVPEDIAKLAIESPPGLMKDILQDARRQLVEFGCDSGGVALRGIDVLLDYRERIYLPNSSKS